MARVTIIPNYYINQGGGGFRREHMIIRDDDRGQEDERPTWWSWKEQRSDNRSPNVRSK